MNKELVQFENKLSVITDNTVVLFPKSLLVSSSQILRKVAEECKKKVL